jgi:hypothetical protein
MLFVVGLVAGALVASGMCLYHHRRAKALWSIEREMLLATLEGGAFATRRNGARPN